MTNMRHAMTFLLFVLAVHVCHGTSQSQSIKPIRNVAKLPVSLKEVTGRKTKTIELGVYRIGNNQRDVLLHLYADSAGKSPSAHLDLFTLHSRRFTRIQSLKIQRPDVYLAPPAPSVAENLYSFKIYEIQWLDIKKKIQPIIALRVPNYRGFDEGKIQLFIFSNGIKQTPVQQAFDYFDGWGTSQFLSFRSTEEQDQILLSDDYERTQGGPDYVESRSTIYQWNGKQFALVK